MKQGDSPASLSFVDFDAQKYVCVHYSRINIIYRVDAPFVATVLFLAMSIIIAVFLA